MQFIVFCDVNLSNRVGIYPYPTSHFRRSQWPNFSVCSVTNIISIQATSVTKISKNFLTIFTLRLCCINRLL